MVIKIIVDQRLLEVSYKHTLPKKQTIILDDSYRLRLSRMPVHITLVQDWVFDPQNGLIIHKKKKICIYAPTVSAESLLGLTIPIDDIKKPKCWNYANNELEIIYTTLKKDIEVTLLATFNEQGITLSISAPKNYKPRLTIAYDATSMIRFMDHLQATIETVKYNRCLHTIYNGITHKFVVHLIDTDPLHKRFLRTFIPRSHRPYIGGTSAYRSAYGLSLAAMLLDPIQRDVLMDTPLPWLSERGHQMLHQIKTDLYETKS